MFLMKKKTIFSYLIYEDVYNYYNERSGEKSEFFLTKNKINRKFFIGVLNIIKTINYLI